MELVLTKEDLEPLPSRTEDLIFKPSGFLNSHYKSIVKEIYNKPDTSSIFNLRQRIKTYSYVSCCGVGVALKLSIFLTIILLIF